MRLLLLLGGDIERNPGPRRARALQPRGPLDTEAGYAPSTTRKMWKVFAAFVEYLVAVQGVVCGLRAQRPGPAGLLLIRGSPLQPDVVCVFGL